MINSLLENPVNFRHIWQLYNIFEQSTYYVKVILYKMYRNTVLNYFINNSLTKKTYTSNNDRLLRLSLGINDTSSDYL